MHKYEECVGAPNCCEHCGNFKWADCHGLDEIQALREQASEVTRTFDTGATRDTAAGKIDYEGHLSPLVIEAYGVFMNYNRTTRDGSFRSSDNWQKGIPSEAYMSSLWRHFLDVWKAHRGLAIGENLVWALCAVLFNASGMLHEILKANPQLLADSLADMEKKRGAK